MCSVVNSCHCTLASASDADDGRVGSDGVNGDSNAPVQLRAGGGVVRVYHAENEPRAALMMRVCVFYAYMFCGKKAHTHSLVSGMASKTRIIASTHGKHTKTPACICAARPG